MIQSFIWMFKSKYFINHILKISISSLILYLIGLSLLYFIKFIYPNISTEIFNYIKLINLGLPFLLTQGYFWNLVDKVIKREVDIETNNIYEDKIKHFFVINLPKIKPVSLIWRGFASIIASLLMYVPYLALITISKLSGTYETLSPIFVTSVYFAYYLFFPAFFYNYAKTNSVLGMMNIRKAVYIMGNFTLNYCFVIILLASINFLNYLIDINISQYISNNLFENNILKTLSNIILITFMWLKYLYLIFVNAYIIGTITPPREW